MTLPAPCIPASIVDRLAKVAGLLGSAHDGERAAAAYRATEILKANGLTWRQLVEAAGPRATPRIDVAQFPPWREQLRRCADSGHLLSRWERKFVGSLLAWRGQPSDRQLSVLAGVYARIARP